MATLQATPPIAPVKVGIKPIILATDFSPASKAALVKAIEMARKEGAELIVAHVYEPPADLSHSGVADDVIAAELEETIRHDVERQLETVLAEVRKEEVPVRGEILAGHAAKRLADLADKTGAGLLVVGTHGRTGLRKIVLGSIASQVIATAPCPVLTVR